MCYRTLNIKNSSLHFDPTCDPLRMNVPCGQCGECRTNLQNSFEARVYYEYLLCTSTPVEGTHTGFGYVFFQTFTYNEWSVPKRHGMYCFDSRHFTLFMKNLRNELKRKFGIPGDAVKVFWTCEYGGDTFRPHYHALFFVYCGITPDELAELCHHNWCSIEKVKHQNRKYKWTEYVRHSLGYCDTNNIDDRRRHTPMERVVNAQGALSYVSKYVCKDFDFLQVIAKQKHGNYDGEELTVEDKKYMYPFHRQSNHLGECMKDMVDIDMLMDGKCLIPDKEKGVKLVTLPQYIDRKVFYNYDPSDKCFKLNDKGIEMKKHRFLHNTYYVKEQILFIFNNLDSLWTPKTQDKYLHGLSKEYCKDKLSEFLPDKVDELVSYILLYKDVENYYSKFLDQYVDISALNQHLLEMRLEHRYRPERRSFLYYDEDDVQAVYRAKHFYKYTYNNCRRFRGFEHVVFLINGINKAFCDLQQLEYIRKQNEKSRQKKLFHSLYR